MTTVSTEPGLSPPYLSYFNVNVTGNHPILTKNGWVVVAHLKPGDYVLSYDNKTNSFVYEKLLRKVFVLANVSVYSIRTNNYKNIVINNLVFSQ